MSEKIFKLVCGAGNKNIKEIEKLTRAYVSAAAKLNRKIIIDICPEIDPIMVCTESAIDAIKNSDREYDRRKLQIMASFGISKDPHIRKARMTQDGSCDYCQKCIEACNQNAIMSNKKIKKLSVNEDKCIGCGYCWKQCKQNTIEIKYEEYDFRKKLLDVIALIDGIEIHIGDGEELLPAWNIVLEYINRLTFVSLSVSRLQLSDNEIKNIIEKTYEISKDKLIIQADGIAMSGRYDDYNTTLQAIAITDMVNKIGFPISVFMSGGTNNASSTLASICGVDYDGIAYGTYARNLIKGKSEKKAIELAEWLIDRT